VSEPVSDAVILMAGAGSRLRPLGGTVAKPLIPLLGRPLISYTLETLARVGINRVCAVVGYESDAVTSETQRLLPRGMTIEFVQNADWQKQNGLSVLSAAGRVRAPFLLTMCDHLFDHTLVDLLVQGAFPGQINLAVDRKIDSIFDIDDAMKVRTQGDRMIAIGKTLTDFDAIDTGMFVCAESLFDYLERARINGDCSLADGIRAAATDDHVRVVDIGDAWWQDVDTPEMMAQAETHLLARPGRNRAVVSRSDTRHEGKQ
jgi:1L-myo-inositol 1-phosphate cytidylyltransferase